MILTIDPKETTVLPVQPAVSLIIIDAPFCISRQEPAHLSSLMELVRQYADQCIPIMGIGFGARLIAAAFGGEILYIPSKVETGSCEVYKLALAESDPLFHDMPAAWNAVCIREDDIFALPLAAVPLVNSERTQFQAFKIVGKPVYGLQFQPGDALMQKFSLLAGEGA